MKEIWLPVKDFEDYMVSNYGRVKSLKFGRERILKAGVNRYGYLQVVLSKDGKRKTFQVHRLVAEAFIPNHNSLPQVNHRNEDKRDNRVENLEWCTQAYNINYGTRNAMVAAANAKQVAQLDRETGEVLRIWPSANEIQRQLGFAKSHISNCALDHKNYSHAYGYIWRYV